MRTAARLDRHRSGSVKRPVRDCRKGRNPGVRRGRAAASALPRKGRAGALPTCQSARTRKEALDPLRLGKIRRLSDRPYFRAPRLLGRRGAWAATVARTVAHRLASPHIANDPGRYGRIRASLENRWTGEPRLGGSNPPPSAYSSSPTAWRAASRSKNERAHDACPSRNSTTASNGASMSTPLPRARPR
jgi:hypothetical protein